MRNDAATGFRKRSNNLVYYEDDMPTNIKLSATFVEQAKRYAHLQRRSLSKQIEHWSQIGKIVKENPNLPYSLIHEMRVADQEEVIGEYTFN